MSDKDEDFLANLPRKNSTAKDIVLPDGEVLYNYLRKNSPEELENIDAPAK
jgi:hypothetical protein